MFSIKTIFITIILLLTVNLKSQDLQINEVLSKNYNGIQTFEGKNEDWIEIYNNTNDTIQLNNYFLSDDIHKLNKYQFPLQSIFPNSFVIVFASGITDDINNELHCNFSINSYGETILLSKQGIVINKMVIPVLVADVSFGRLTENNIETNILDIPSPNFSNQLSNHLNFSHQSGFFKKEFNLTITNLKETHTIYYTLNGNLPDQNSLIYDGFLRITDRSILPNGISEIRTSPEANIYHHNWQKPKNKVKKITSIKFASFYSGQRTSAVYTKSFFVKQPNSELGSICLTVDSNLLFNNKTGLYVPGEWYNSDYPNFTGNYFQSKRLPANISVFNNNQKLLVSQDCEIRIKGKTTRASAQKSLKVYAKKKYGKKSFDAQLLENDFSEYKKIILRNTQGSSLANLIADDLCNLLIADLDIDHTKTQFYNMFLNGEYWGIHSMRNELSTKFLSQKYQIEKSDISIIDIDYNPIKGNDSSFLRMIDFISANDLSLEDNYNYVRNRLDIESYIDYQIAEMFLNNNDWVGNNSKLWKSNKEDSKWRFIFYDLDGTFTFPENNMFSYCTATESEDWRNASKYTFLFRNLLKNNEFKNQFINRYYLLLETTFSYQNTIINFNKVIESVNPEIDKNFMRWQYPTSQTEWILKLEKELGSFLLNRPCIVKQQLNSFFNLQKEHSDCSKKYKENIDFKIFPNPNNGDFKIKILSNNTSTIINYSIYNTTGEKVEEDTSILSEENVFTINVVTLPKGTFTIMIETNNNYYGIEKFIISN